MKKQTNFEDIQEFHKVFKVKSFSQATLGDFAREKPPLGELLELRVNLLTEECREVRDAIFHYSEDPSRDAYFHLAKELIDLVVVTLGTAEVLNMNWEAMWDEVHRSNMAKAPGGVITRRADGKILKPEGWQPPNLAAAHNRAVADMQLPPEVATPIPEDVVYDERLRKELKQRIDDEVNNFIEQAARELDAEHQRRKWIDSHAADIAVWLRSKKRGRAIISDEKSPVPQSQIPAEELAAARKSAHTESAAQGTGMWGQLGKELKKQERQESEKPTFYFGTPPGTEHTDQNLRPPQEP